MLWLLLHAKGDAFVRVCVVIPACRLLAYPRISPTVAANCCGLTALTFGPAASAR